MRQYPPESEARGGRRRSGQGTRTTRAGAVLGALLALGLVALPLGGQETGDAAREQAQRSLQVEALRKQAQEALDAKRWPEALPLLQQLLDLEPGRWDLRQVQGNTLLNLGRYQEAIDRYGKGIALCQAELPKAKTKPETLRLQTALGQMLTSQGNAYLKLGQAQQAIPLYTRAAELAPDPGLAYFNLAATLYNQGNMEGAALACDKAIAADPRRADAYFIKGSALYGNGSMDAKNRYIVPPGTVEALTKYLELAPKGGHADDVRAMLEALGLPIQTTYPQKRK